MKQKKNSISMLQNDKICIFSLKVTRYSITNDLNTIRSKRKKEKIVENIYIYIRRRKTYNTLQRIQPHTQNKKENDNRTK